MLGLCLLLTLAYSRLVLGSSLRMLRLLTFAHVQLMFADALPMLAYAWVMVAYYHLCQALARLDQVRHICPAYAKLLLGLLARSIHLRKQRLC